MSEAVYLVVITISVCSWEWSRWIQGALPLA